MPDYELLMRSANWTPEQRDVYTRLARAALARSGQGRRIIAVDGRNGSGKTRLAEELQVAYAREGATAFVASLSDFHHPRAVRERHRTDEWRAYYDYTYNLQELLRSLVEPFLLGGSAAFVTRAYDLPTESFVEPEWQTTGKDATLILEGEFLARPTLERYFRYFIRVEAADAVRGQRLHQRDGLHPLVTHPSHARAQAAHTHYEQVASPFARADVIVDNSDWARPVIVR